VPDDRKPQLFRRCAWLIFSIFCAGSMWFYVTWIWNANQSPQFSDLYAPWWATHELLLHGRNPYTPAVAHEIQTVIYGAPISGSYSGDPSAMGGGFAYPLHVMFLMAPTVWVPFPIVREISTWLCPAIIFLSLKLWLYAMDWEVRRFKLLIISLFVLGSYPSLQGMKLQNLSVLAACLIAGGIACVVTSRLVIAGILLSAATFKPQFVVLLIVWLALWTSGDWRTRRSLAWSFLASSAVLLSGTELLLRGWTRDFLRVAAAYRKYTYGHSLLDIWFTQRGGSFVAMMVMLIAITLCWKYRLGPANQTSFFLVCSLTLATTLLVIPSIEPHAQLVLLPSALVFVRYFKSIFGSGRWQRLSFVMALSLLAWEWIAACGLTMASLWLPRMTLLHWWMLPLYTSPLLPLGMLLPLGNLLITKQLKASPAPQNQTR